MPKTGLTIAFLAAVVAAGVLIATRPTVASGRVMAANLYEELRERNRRLESVECDPEIPIGQYGAVFHCTLHGDDGSTARLEYHMKRDGSLLPPKLVESTGATRERTQAGDPRNN